MAHLKDVAGSLIAGRKMEEGNILEFSQLAEKYSYISFSVLFQTKSSLVWKSYTQKLRTIFQTNSSLVWKEKN